MIRLLTHCNAMRLLLLFSFLVYGPALTTAKDTSPAGFVGESEMMADLMQMLANFATYMKNDFQECVEPNSDGEQCGCFRGENTMGNDERGVRPNADLSMICAFLVKYGKDTGVASDCWDDLEEMAMKSLFLRDPHALMLENLAYRQIKARQLTTPDGSWLLRPDVGARRMGVEAHRVMMTWLMHYVLPTSSSLISHLSPLTSHL